ncbi:MAG: N-acetylgalactosamine 6-sulfate sulfatase, partial [bacterium]|nr:N-acetylgalactosamine 6-sulfate sulfatase [bacterium]
RREGGHYGGQDYYAVRQGDFKLEQNTPFEEPELYNLKDDPLEAHPLDRKHPKFRPLFNALRDHINNCGEVPWQRKSDSGSS